SSYNYDGIFIYYSGYNNIENNICKYNTQYGISLTGAHSNLISYNICRGLSENVNDGIHVGFSNSNTITNNICSYNVDGIYIINSNSNVVANNNCNQNKNGMCLGGTSNTVENNILCENFYGILLSESSNTISNNTCNFNEAHGIYIMETSNNQITGNSLNFNDLAGVYFLDSSSNHLLNNICSKNKIGFELWISSNNIFAENIISYNSDKGFFINNYCNDNEIYRNNIILNSVQVLDNGNNTWNKFNREGNYWSNYYGEDNGANGSKADDGIGDTDIPHADDHDYYPLMYIVGWAPDGPPEFNQLDHLDTDGKYTFNWNKILKSDGYILEEDLNDTFPSPIVIYEGDELSYKIQNQANGVYFYRVKAYQDFMETKWSNITNIIVDYAPSAPTGLAAENLPGNIVLLSWNQNLESDVIGYQIYLNNTADINGSYHLFATLGGLNTSLLLRNLAENTTYYLKIIAFDVHNTNSLFSNVTSITTLGKVAPNINNSPEDIVMLEDTIDNSSINMHDWFMDFNFDLLTFSCLSPNHITVQIDQETGNVILKPAENWTGEEILIFYAYDGMFNVCDEIKITVTPVEDPPGAAQIESPKEGARIEYGTLVNFSGSCVDPDVEFGDKLIYKWSSDITGDLGKSTNLTNILLELGEHEIRFDVWDSANQTSRTSIKITVFETNESDSDRDGIPNVWERRYGLNPIYNGDSTGDWDADSFSNLDEYLADTNPIDPNSYPVKKR
ncbi:MAG: right-handed parallel beta-helix repeat-containing protein, partial [Thermoplasmata archaeon]|nr:right-handed parallel beta-helix repeat-containing protein [Thermoplasmata archaeon]